MSAAIQATLGLSESLAAARGGLGRGAQLRESKANVCASRRNKFPLTCSSLHHEAASAEKPAFEGFTSSKHSPMSPAIALDSFVATDVPQKTTKIHHDVPAIEEPFELRTAEDFAGIADEEGRIFVLGFGSLMSEKSARITFPNLRKFSAARLRGFRRVYAHAAGGFFERGIARLETKEISSLSVELREGSEIGVSIFSTPMDGVPDFIEREHEFRFLAVPPSYINVQFTRDGETLAPSRPAVVCSRYSDEEYRQVRLEGCHKEYHRRYGRWGVERIWDDSYLPCRLYLRHCVLASQKLSHEAHNSFLDETFLGDRATTIRQYLQAKPDIMVEEPPAHLKYRYGG